MRIEMTTQLISAAIRHTTISAVARSTALPVTRAAATVVGLVEPARQRLLPSRARPDSVAHERVVRLNQGVWIHRLSIATPAAFAAAAQSARAIVRAMPRLAASGLGPHDAVRHDGLLPDLRRRTSCARASAHSPSPRLWP